ncbi:MAG: acnR [Gemmatimonadetes bacterium]|nr:acnR [Gemmatimonadota bacterium]
MISRERILEAAARVYAKHGFRGATTRLIAIEAGVNEVTLFRTFGSKGALLEAVLGSNRADVVQPHLPDEPQDPAAELLEFVNANLEHVRELRPLLIHTMGEIDERPEAAEFACRGRRMVHDAIVSYLRKLQQRGMADQDADVEVAAVVLTGTVMSDAMARSIVPDVYPPREHAAERYVSCFLRMIGGRKAVAAPVKKSRTRSA